MHGRLVGTVANGDDTVEQNEGNGDQHRESKMIEQHPNLRSSRVVTSSPSHLADVIDGVHIGQGVIDGSSVSTGIETRT
jgi:hypothetical protein